ncbi:ABC transporter substrate-binding protein, partial [candidate division WOR-3 bacterium]|nr:ABC transporter substrate-binding protein [candidate division WOR-3 bacterium]
SERLEFPIELMIEAKCCYPERFADIDISEWSSDYYKEIYGIEDDKVEEIKLAQQYYRLEIE